MDKMRIDDGFEIEHGDFKIESGDGDHIWVTINNIQVKVGYTKDGVIVDFWATHGEDDIPLETAEVSFSEAEKDQEEEG